MYKPESKRSSNVSNTTTFKDARDDIVSTVEDAASVTRQQLRSIAREAGAKVQDFISDRKVQMQDVRDTAERTIQTRPFATTAAVFIGGLILGRLLRR